MKPVIYTASGETTKSGECERCCLKVGMRPVQHLILSRQMYVGCVISAQWELNLFFAFCEKHLLQPLLLCGTDGRGGTHLAAIAAVDELLGPGPVGLVERLARLGGTLQSLGVDLLGVKLLGVSRHDPSEEGPGFTADRVVCEHTAVYDT